MHDFKSHFRRDFVAYCTGPVSVHLAMACVSCSFDSFSVCLLSLKQQQNLMKIMFSCIHFPIWPYPPKLMKKLSYTGKLYGLTGMIIHVIVKRSGLPPCVEDGHYANPPLFWFLFFFFFFQWSIWGCVSTRWSSLRFVDRPQQWKHLCQCLWRWACSCLWHQGAYNLR